MISVRLLLLSSLPDGLDSLASSLPLGGEDAERLCSIGKAALRERLGARVALRELLERRGILTQTPIVRDTLGKPHFTDASLPPFNLSHTDGLAVAVLGDGMSGSVGVDLQVTGTVRRPDAVAARFFDERARAALAAGAYGEDSFFILWTRVEAVAKMHGNGIVLERTASDQPPAHTRSYRLTGDGKVAYLTVAAEHPIHAIEILSDKEISLYELPY